MQLPVDFFNEVTLDEGRRENVCTHQASCLQEASLACPCLGTSCPYPGTWRRTCRPTQPCLGPSGSSWGGLRTDSSLGVTTLRWTGRRLASLAVLVGKHQLINTSILTRATHGLLSWGPVSLRQRFLTAAISPMLTAPISATLHFAS